MRAFQSLINDLSLKNLIPALKTIESKPPLPFYVLKARCSSEEPAQNLGLSITFLLFNLEENCPTKHWVTTLALSPSGVPTICTELPKLRAIGHPTE